MADRYLRQTTTGHIYIWAPHYAVREDMEEVVRNEAGEFVLPGAAPAEAPPEAIPDRPKKRGGKKAAPPAGEALFAD